MNLSTRSNPSDDSTLEFADSILDSASSTCDAKSMVGNTHPRDVKSMVGNTLVM